MGGEEKALAIVLDRTSGDEDEGQDVRAQLAETAHRTEAAGFAVLERHPEEDVPGDTQWDVRRVLQTALRAARERAAVLVVREVSRLSRYRPHVGMALIETIPNLSVLGKAHWERRDGAWADESDEAEFFRFLDLWLAWKEKRHTSERTARAMDAIKKGRRATKTGQPVGRPSVVDKLSADERAWCEAELAKAGASLLRVHRDLLVRRRVEGPNAFTDPKAKRRASISYDSLARALGLRKDRASAKRDLTQNTESPSEESLLRNGPVMRKARTGQNSVPATMPAARPAETPGHGQAITDGGA